MLPAGGLRHTIRLAAFVALAAPALGSAQSDVLDFERRVAAQRAIERVYWELRSWPAENRGAKPSFESMLSEEQLRAKVENYLAQSNALAVYWQRPITAEQLEAEVARMVRESRAPDSLRRLFSALGDDSRLIVETLARQKLAERLLRNWFAADERVHGDVRSRAEQALAASTDIEDWIERGGIVERFAWERSTEPESPLAPTSQALLDELRIELAGSSWEQHIDWLAARLGPALPLHTWSALYEEADAFVVVQLEERSTEHVAVRIVSWPKRAFDEWWAEQRKNAAYTAVEIESTSTASEIEAPATEGDPCVEDTWSLFSGAPERFLHTAVWTGAEMIVWGGESQLAAGQRYDPALDTWAPMSSNGAPSPERQQHTAVWTGSEMIVWGGMALGSTTHLATGGRYVPASDTWTAVTPAGAPSARLDHSAVWTGSKMIVWGGRIDSPPSRTNTGGIYDPASDTWQAVTTLGAPQPRSEHTAVWTGTRMLVWGGNVAGTDVLQNGASYDPAQANEALQWEPISMEGAPTARAEHTAVWTGSEMVVWGGRGAQNYLQSGGRYRPSDLPHGDSWSPTSLVGAPGRRFGHTSLWTGTQMLVWGGIDNGFFNVGAGGRYNPNTNQWQGLATVNEPVGRSDHSAVWTGTEMVVWGGYGDNDLARKTGGRYAPSSDTWVPIGSSAPEARSGHEALWTGAEMIVWGGSSDFGAKTAIRSGGAYDPATSTWVHFTHFGLPDPDAFHFISVGDSVWTGSEIVHWGGCYLDCIFQPPGCYFAYNTKFSHYDPNTHSWSVAQTESGPPGECRPTAVWTGTEMVTWSGENGHRYDPSTETWTPVSTLGAPTTSSDPGSSVWTGSQMIVYGPQKARYSPQSNSWQPISLDGAPPHGGSIVWTGSEMVAWSTSGVGGLYDPQNNSWTPMSTAGVEPRANHTTVWTGNEMIVWSGTLAGVSTNTGARYDPIADTWAPTSLVEPPSARKGAAAVWTGTKMLVWGGDVPDVGPSDDGGAYCAVSALDSDGDGVLNAGDCAPADTSLWATPAPATALVLSGAEPTQFGWTAPGEPGSDTVLFDLLRSENLGDFSAASCVASDVTAPATTDANSPEPAGVFYYLVRTENGCGSNLGTDSFGEPRFGAACP